MYRIEGQGDWQHTKIWRDGEQITYKQCEFRINQEEECVAVVDDVFGTIDSIIITGVYMIIGYGKFNNSRLFYMREMLHGVQWLKGSIKQEGHPELTIGTILLPNLVEVEEEVPPREIDAKLRDNLTEKDR